MEISKPVEAQKSDRILTTKMCYTPCDMERLPAYFWRTIHRDCDGVATQGRVWRAVRCRYAIGAAAVQTGWYASASLGDTLVDQFGVAFAPYARALLVEHVGDCACILVARERTEALPQGRSRQLNQPFHSPHKKKIARMSDDK
jgi:hypothetical protein